MRNLLFFFTLLASVAHAQQPYPSRPVHWFVPFPPGGSTDASARVIAPKLAERLGQPVVIENRPGAGGTTGVEQAARMPPDGYTIAIAGLSALATVTMLENRPNWNPDRDVVPITLLATSPLLLVADPALPAGAREIIALARSKPGTITAAHGGPGTAMHLSIELLKQMTGTEIVQVPYKGSGPAVVAAAGGQTSLAVADLTTALPLMSAGKLRAVAVLTKDRSLLAPGIPTLAEAAGLPGYEAAGWFGVVAPAGTPPSIIARLNAELTAVMRMPEVVERMNAVALEPLPSTPEEFAAFTRLQTAKWAEVIRKGKLRAE